MRSRPIVAIIIVSLLLGSVPATVLAAEDPRFETTVPEPRLTAGAEQVLTVQLVNDADEVDDTVKTASNVQVRMLEGVTPFEVITGTQRIGALQDGTPSSIPFRIVVPADAPAGDYDIPLEVTYEYDGDERETTTVFATVTIPEHPVFVIESVSSSVSIAEEGTASVTIRNNGSATAFASQLTVETLDSVVAIEQGRSTTQYTGDWAAGQTRTVSVDLFASEAATVREYGFSITPSYEDDNGIQRQVMPISFGVTPEPRQSFAFGSIDIEPYSETAATMEMTVTNTGDRPVQNAVASLSSGSPTVQVVEPTTPAGTLQPGESTTVSFELQMSPGATAGPRQFTGTVQYERDDGQVYRSEPVSFRQAVPVGQSVLAFEPVNNTFANDDTNPFTVRVTNTGDEPVTDVHARILVQPPYSSDSPTSYVDSLAPGESALLRFEVTTPNDGVDTTDAIAITANATAPNNRVVQAGPTLVPFEISTPESPTGGTTGLIIGVIVVVAILAAGWWWLNR